MISLDKPNNMTVAVCDVCQIYVNTGRADGVIPEDWMTGHLWLDVSLTEQKQMAICFCPSCKPYVVTSLSFTLELPEDGGIEERASEQTE